MDRNPRAEKAVLIHLASSTAEAMVIRGLLESSGIASPGSVTTEQFPVNELREGDHAVEVVVRESQAVDARRIIAEYLRTNEEIEAEDSSQENPSS